MLLALNATALVSFAEETGDVGYDIQAVIPENQVDKTQSYFDLRMTPKQEQTIQVKVNNTSDESSDFVVSINQAYTNNQGFIDYSQAVQPDKSMNYKIADIATYAKNVTVPAQSSKVVDIQLKMPAETFDGQILAGIHVVKKNKSEKTSGITSQYAYVLGLKLTETDTAVKRDLQLVSVKPAVSFGATSVVAKLRNPTMDAYGHLKYTAKVTKKGSSEALRNVSYDKNMQLAPTSTYDFAIDWQGKKLVAGKYTLHLTVADALDNVWQFDEDFTITGAAAKKVNKVVVTKANQIPFWVYLLIGVLLLLILLLIILILVSKRRKKAETTESEE